MAGAAEPELLSCWAGLRRGRPSGRCWSYLRQTSSLSGVFGGPGTWPIWSHREGKSPWWLWRPAPEMLMVLLLLGAGNGSSALIGLDRPKPVRRRVERTVNFRQALPLPEGQGVTSAKNGTVTCRPRLIARTSE
uniref:(northern house mosquito) hypothetical protein n=1 Tax=Culex pipiens TaxID=7175 RepID=A0A8D8BMP1_CULPI